MLSVHQYFMHTNGCPISVLSCFALSSFTSHRSAPSLLSSPADSDPCTETKISLFHTTKTFRKQLTLTVKVLQFSLEIAPDFFLPEFIQSFPTQVKLAGTPFSSIGVRRSLTSGALSMKLHSQQSRTSADFTLFINIFRLFLSAGFGFPPAPTRAFSHTCWM